MEKGGNSITPDELAKQPSEVREAYATALDWATNATNLWQAGVAHGIVLGLEKAGLVSDPSMLDRLSKGVLKVMPESVFDSVPEEDLARLGKRLIRPAAPSTQRRRAN